MGADNFVESESSRSDEGNRGTGGIGADAKLSTIKALLILLSEASMDFFGF